MSAQLLQALPDLQEARAGQAQAGRPSLARKVARAAGALALSFIVIMPAIRPAGARGPDGIADVPERVMDAVVNIKATQKVAQRNVPLPQLPPGLVSICIPPKARARAPDAQLTVCPDCGLSDLSGVDVETGNYDIPVPDTPLDAGFGWGSFVDPETGETDAQFMVSGGAGVAEDYSSAGVTQSVDVGTPVAQSVETTTNNFQRFMYDPVGSIRRSLLVPDFGSRLRRDRR